MIQTRMARMSKARFQTPAGWLGLVAFWLAASAEAATLELSVRHVFAGEPLQLGSLRYDTGSREHFSVTRLSYLLSGFAFSTR